MDQLIRAAMIELELIKTVSAINKRELETVSRNNHYKMINNAASVN